MQPFLLMKRTNLILDEDVLAEAMRLTGERTWSAVVRRALEELIQRAKARRILELSGSGAWEGDLSAMRGDRVAESAAKPKKGRGRGAR